MIGWILVGLAAGIVLTAVMTRFWDSISSWLNNTAANAVEKVFGYNARKYMERAVVGITRVRDKVINHGTIITKKNINDSFYEKVTYESEAWASALEEEVLRELEKKEKLINTFEYHG